MKGTKMQKKKHNKEIQLLASGINEKINIYWSP